MGAAAFGSNVENVGNSAEFAVLTGCSLVVVEMCIVGCIACA